MLWVAMHFLPHCPGRMLTSGIVHHLWPMHTKGHVCMSACTYMRPVCMLMCVCLSLSHICRHTHAGTISNQQTTAHSHTYTHTHTHTHTYTHTYTHTHTHTRTHMRTHTHTCTNTCAPGYAHTHQVSYYLSMHTQKYSVELTYMHTTLTCNYTDTQSVLSQGE